MSKREGEVREVPFLNNDMKNQAPTTGKRSDRADAPGKADSEFTEEQENDKPIGNKTVDADDAQLDETTKNKV